MLFRDAKNGDTLFIYDRVAVTLTTDKIMSVSAPKLDKNNVSNGMVVDVVANNVTYSFKDTTAVGYAGNLIISTDRASILREVEIQKANDETQIARVDQLKAELPKLDSIIDSLSPERKEKKQNEVRMAKMEDSITALKEMVELLIKQKNGKQ